MNTQPSTDYYSDLSRLSKTLIWLTAADPELLKKIPKGELMLFSMLGSAMLVPATVAAFTLPYFFHEFGVIEGNGWVLSTICFLLILTLERLLVRGMGRKPFVQLGGFSFSSLLGVLLRIVLASVMGALVAIPLEHRIFEQDIDAYLNEQQAEGLAELKTEQDSALRRIDAYYTPMAAQLDAEYQLLNDRYLVEIDGSGGTQQKGLGPIAQAKRAARDSAQVRFERARAEWAAKRRESNNQYTQAVAQLRSQYSNGLIARHKALRTLTWQDWSVFLIVLLLKAFFLLLDVTPIVAKTLNHTKYYDTHELIRDQAFKSVVALEARLIIQREEDRIAHAQAIQQYRLQADLADAKKRIDIERAYGRNELREEELQAILTGQHRIAENLTTHLHWLGQLADHEVETAFRREINEFLDLHYQHQLAV